ncbi:kinase protein wishful thinking [Tachypleus tridentatus]|uniref:kinase protein wishful thinking n=1 Tax=Tachypleus tridentatus TaxID=6853 RepID=UPI003FD12E87
MHIFRAVVILWISGVLDVCSANGTKCAVTENPQVKYSHGKTSGEVRTVTGYEGGTEIQHCPKGTCYTVWQGDFNTTSNDVVVLQGCWENAGSRDCDSPECVSKKKPTKPTNNTKFCCCTGYLCNVNFTHDYDPSSEESELIPPVPQFIKEPASKAESVIIALASFCSLCVITVVGILIFRKWPSSPKISNDSVNMVEGPSSLNSTFDLDSLKIQENIGMGRYGSVARGTLNGFSVAIKTFAFENKQYFQNERDIYSLPLMDYPCLPKYFGSEERIGEDGQIEYLLVISYASNGCLQDYLCNNTIDWPTLCKMMQSITQGLAYLHSDICKGDLVKPCIAHRDLTSRNILVNDDLFCVICDFGFAIQIAGPKCTQNGEQQDMDSLCLTDVGTLRYMAPEALEGAVNLRDCESSLKQVDMYALGLILWEIATRCSDLYQGLEVPEYKLPFEAELGKHPTVDQMQVLVARHKAHPLFPEIWKDSNPAVRALKETIEDCWDQDAEARLTALCVEERLAEIPVLWERYKAGLNIYGVSPTVNQTGSSQDNVTIINSSSGSQRTASTMLSTTATDSSRGNRISQGHASNTSENTLETILTVSPSESSAPPITGGEKNNIANLGGLFYPKVIGPLQPHQGRNPCMERNLMVESFEEVSVEGNQLMDKGSKYHKSPLNHTGEDIFENLNLSENLESNALVSSDVLGHNSNPIPYLQNAVRPYVVMPKQPNMPGNGHNMIPANSNEKKFSKKPFTFLQWKESNHGFIFGIKNFFSRNSSDKKKVALQEKQQTHNHENGTTINIGGSFNFNSLKNVQAAPKDTIVCIMDQKGKSDPYQTVVHTIEKNIDLEKAKNYVSCDQRFDSNISLSGDALETEGQSQRRPSTLPLESQAPAESSCDRSTHLEGVDQSTDECVDAKNKTEKIVKRVKTPFQMKVGRFSLYNDRIMSCKEEQSKEFISEHKAGDSSKSSLSVPHGINRYCLSESVPLLQETKEKSGCTIGDHHSSKEQKLAETCDITKL